MRSLGGYTLKKKEPKMEIVEKESSPDKVFHVVWQETRPSCNRTQKSKKDTTLLPAFHLI